MRRTYFVVGVYLMALVALVDQGTKWLAMDMIAAVKKTVSVTSFFNITLSYNKGVTFGMFNNHSDWMPYILLLVALAVCSVLLYWLSRTASLKEALGLGFVLGGAVGNIIDRVRFGAVVDFLDFHYAGYHWYTFNIADSAIVLGVALLLLDHLASSRGGR